MRLKRGKDVVRCAIVGYGPAFDMGMHHGNSINAVEGLKLVAACDTDPARVEAAKKQFPGIKGFTRLASLLRWGEFDLATIATPHNTHAPLALQCLQAGKHVILEKPMCLRAADVTSMIKAANKAGLMVTTYQNRRLDGDHLARLDLIKKGALGDIYRIEAFIGRYGHPGTWWRSDKKISGGILFDWGAHFIDQILTYIPGKVKTVQGFFQKCIWNDVTNEDEGQVIILFDSGATADFQITSIAHAGKPRWRILGEKGAIVDNLERAFKFHTFTSGVRTEGEVRYQRDCYDLYYQYIAQHLFDGKPLFVPPEFTRRVIGVMETAVKSGKSGKPEKVPYE